MKHNKFRAWNQKSVIYHGFIIDENGQVFDKNMTAQSEWRVMQYVGMKDRNGTPLFEGDYVKIWLQNEFGSFTPREAKVQWIGDFMTFPLQLTDGRPERVNAFEIDEVIGNIYDGKFK